MIIYLHFFIHLFIVCGETITSNLAMSTLLLIIYLIPFDVVKAEFLNFFSYLSTYFGRFTI